MSRTIFTWLAFALSVEIACAQILSIKRGGFGSPEKRWLLQFQNYSEISIANETEPVFLRKYDTDYEIEDESTMRYTSWFMKMPLLPIVFAQSSYIPEGPCKRQARRYLQELKNGTLWAAQMFDSSTKYPEGIISGHMRQLGNFDECYNIYTQIPSDDVDSGFEEVDGRYCLVDIQYERRDMPPVKQASHTLDFDFNDSVWETLREKGDFRRVPRYKMQMALCVPSVCTAKDVEIALKEPLAQFGAENNMNVQTFVKPKFCQTYKEAPKFSTGGKILCGFLLSLIALIVISTWYDGSLNGEEIEGNSALRDFIICFSARRNFKSIFEINYSHPGLDCTYFGRSFLMMCVIFGHRMIQYYGNPLMNTYYLERLYLVKSSAMLFNGPIITDSFFAMGGLLVTYGILDELDKRRRMNFIAAILIRFLRLTPPYMLIIAFYALILPHLGSGPLWKVFVEDESERCYNNWWSNMLYINSYIHEKNFCMFQSWYLTVDFHLYIIALFLIYIFWRTPRYIGYSILGVFTIASCIIPFAITYMYRAKPIFVAFPGDTNLLEMPVFTQYYIKTHMRITAYFVGVISGAIIHDHKNSTWRLPKRWSRIAFIFFVVVLPIVVQEMAHQYFDPNAKPSLFKTALYAALHRPLYAFGLPCIAVILMTIGDGLDVHYHFLTPRWVQPVARLSYAAFLVHHINQLYDLGFMRTARMFSFRDNFAYYVTDLLYTFLLSLMIAVGIEGPCRKLEKRFIMKRTEKPVKQNQDIAVKKIS